MSATMALGWKLLLDERRGGAAVGQRNVRSCCGRSGQRAQLSCPHDQSSVATSASVEATQSISSGKRSLKQARDADMQSAWGAVRRAR